MTPKKKKNAPKINKMASAKKSLQQMEETIAPYLEPIPFGKIPPKGMWIPTDDFYSQMGECDHPHKAT